ncbi:MAG: hypothetical protein JNJ54_03640 [Myxococcaceae bacterium]|nr:hypothetical protein [Myxococcaceae bacterium]
MRLWITVVSSLLIANAACVKLVVKTPTEAYVSLAGQRATYRDWSRVADLCTVDKKIVEGDFESMNALLANFLGQTSAGADGAWADEHVALLEEGQRVLPVALDLQARGVKLASTAGCRFDGLTRTQELTDLAKKRLAEAPALLETVKAKKALAAWRDALPASHQSAKEKSCVAPAKGKAPAAPVVFAAFEDEKGRTEWLFCDGAKVAASPGSPPAFEAAPADPTKKPKKAPDPKAYLEAQTKYPAAEVSRAPRLSVKKPAKDDAPEPD